MKKRKYYRKCGICGERYEQSEMVRDECWAYTRSMRRTDMKRLTYFDGGKWRLKIGNTEYSGRTVFLTREEAALRREQDG